jgi:hypothetical protein
MNSRILELEEMLLALKSKSVEDSALVNTEISKRSSVEASLRNLEQVV